MWRIVWSCALLAIPAGCKEFRVGATDDAALAPDAAVICPGDYTHTAIGTYKLHTTATPFVGAETACENDATDPSGHTHLAVAATGGELNVLFAQAAGKRVWIGLNDGESRPVGCPGSYPVHGYWWITDELAAPLDQQTMPWATNEPSDPCNDHCVDLSDTTTELADATCSIGLSFLCECDGHAADPTHYAM